MKRHLEPFLAYPDFDRVGLPALFLGLSLLDLLLAVIFKDWILFVLAGGFLVLTGVMARVTYRRQLRCYRFSAKRAALLGEEEMVALKILLDSEHPLGVTEMSRLLFGDSGPFEKRGHSYDLIQSLWRAGLVERVPQRSDDLSNHRSYYSAPPAAAAYADYLVERERRDEEDLRVGPLGPRSRSSALAG